ALAGRDLARCGLYLSLFFGGFYLLYLLGNHLAVASQAQTVADRFLDNIRNDRLAEAYAESIKPGARPSGDLRQEIELGFNPPRGREAGEFSTFGTQPLVQLIRMGKDTTLTPLGASSEYKTGDPGPHYDARVRYAVSNDLGKFEILIQLQSVD